MLARETRTQSFTKNSDNVMSELLNAIRKVRGKAADGDVPDNTGENSNGSGHIRKKTETSNGFTPVQGGVNGHIGVAENSSVKHSSDISNGINDALPRTLEIVNGVPPAPQVPIAPPQPQSTGSKKSASVTPSSSTSHTPSWTPNRPRRFEANNTINVFAELNSVLQKRFKKNSEEYGEVREAVNKKSGSGDVTPAKKVTERKTGHYSHIKQVSEKLVNGLNIVIVEQNDKPVKSGQDESISGNGDRNSVVNAPPKVNTSKQLTREASQIGAKPKLNDAGGGDKEVVGSSGNVSRLIESYQSSKESLNGSSDSPQTLNNKGIYLARQPVSRQDDATENKGVAPAKAFSQTTLIKTSGTTINLPSPKKNSLEKVADSANEIETASIIENGVKKGYSVVTVEPQQSSVSLSSSTSDKKMSSEDKDSKTKTAYSSCEEEELVKAVVIHGSIGKSQQGRQPLSTQTETAIASIMLDKAIESDSESEVFFQETNDDKSTIVSDSEIDRRKEEIFGASATSSRDRAEEYKKEMKEIKDVLSNSLAQKFNKTDADKNGEDIQVSADLQENKTSSVNGKLLDENENTTQVKYDTSVLVASETKENVDSSSIGLERQAEDGLSTNQINETKDEHLESSPKRTSNLDDYRSPRRRRFSNISSETSSLDSTHNSSGEVVVVADVHVSSDDDKMVDGNVSPLSDESSPLSFGGLPRHQAVSGKVSSEVSYPSEFHTEQKLPSVQEQDKSSMQYPMDNAVSDNVLVSSSQENSFGPDNESNAEKQIGSDEDTVDNGEMKESNELILAQPPSLSSHNSRSSVSNASAAHQEYGSGGSSEVAMETGSERSLTSSLANYDMLSTSDIPKNFGNTSSVDISTDEAPIQQSTPSLNAARGGNSSLINGNERVSGEFRGMESPSESIMNFSEEEVLSDLEPVKYMSDSIEEIKSESRQQSSTHSPSASLTDTEVRNLTRKIDMHQSLLSSSPGISFKSLRNSSHKDDPEEAGTFRPVVAEKSQYDSHRPPTPAKVSSHKDTIKLPTKTPSPNFRPPASVIRYDSPPSNSESHHSSPEITTPVVSEVGYKHDSKTEIRIGKETADQNYEPINKTSSRDISEINNNKVSQSVTISYTGGTREVNNNDDNSGEGTKGSTTVINYTGLDNNSNIHESPHNHSVADTSKEQITVINHSLVAENSQEPATVINHVPIRTVSDRPTNSPPNMSTITQQRSVSSRHEISEDAKENTTVFHYGPPPGGHSHTLPNKPHSQPTVIRYVPVTHRTSGYPRQHSNQSRHHRGHGHTSRSGHSGRRHHVTVEPYNWDHPHEHSGLQAYSQPRGRTTTMFYDFKRRITVPRKMSEESHRSHHSGHHQAGHPQSAVTVMHITPTRGSHHHTSHNVSGYVRESRPKMAGYGPDILVSGRNGLAVENYSSHDTITSLPFSPVNRNTPGSPDQVFSRSQPVQRKPSYTVMTSSTSSFTDSNEADRVFIDLRKPRHRKHRSRSRSRSPEKYPVSVRQGDSFKSESGSSLSKTAMSETFSTDVSNISQNPPMHLVSKRSYDGSEITFEQGVNQPQEHILPGGVTVKIVVNNESKVIIGSSDQSKEGSPFIIDVDEGRMPTANGDGLYKGEEDRPAKFYVDARGLRGELGVQVEGPNSIAKCNIEPERDGVYSVTYVPVEVGKYRAIVKWNGKEIPGSPFHPKVVDARKVKVIGGWQHFMDANNRVHLMVDEEKRIPFDVTDAGPGILTAEVRGPGGKIPCEIENNGSHKKTVCFTPREEGDHHIYAFWSDHTLVNAPFHGYAVNRQRSPDPTKVILSGRGLKEAVVHREAEFQIDGSEAGPGRPDVQLAGVKREIPVRCSSLGGGRYRCTYTPETAGGYLLHITWNDRQLRGSPFKVNVINAHYPQKVVVSGEGLKGGVMGRDINVIIDTRKAGPGELTAHCMGPHLVAYCELEDMRDGTYKLNIRPQEPGRHILQIKYGGEHVLGSPYVLRVGSQPDAGKVRVSGPGVEHGILANFQSRFIVETRGAGAGQLTVRIRGPKGAFQVEMLRDSQKDRTIMCRFDPTETGLYQIFVKWSGVDVPGSPFQVYIVDSQQELMRVMAGQIPAHYQGSTLNRSIYNSEYSSWREDDYRM